MIASGGIIHHLGEATFTHEEALSLVEVIVKKHYEAEDSLFPSFLQAIESFVENATKLYLRLNEPSISKVLQKEFMKLIEEHLFLLLTTRETREPALKFVEKLWDILVEAVEDEEIVNKTLDSWRELIHETELLVCNKDFRIRSYSRKFIHKVIRIELTQELSTRII